MFRKHEKHVYVRFRRRVYLCAHKLRDLLLQQQVLVHGAVEAARPAAAAAVLVQRLPCHLLDIIVFAETEEVERRRVEHFVLDSAHCQVPCRYQRC